MNLMRIARDEVDEVSDDRCDLGAKEGGAKNAREEAQLGLPDIAWDSRGKASAVQGKSA